MFQFALYATAMMAFPSGTFYGKVFEGLEQKPHAMIVQMIDGTHLSVDHVHGDVHIRAILNFTFNPDGGCVDNARPNARASCENNSILIVSEIKDAHGRRYTDERTFDWRARSLRYYEKITPKSKDGDGEPVEIQGVLPAVDRI